MSHRDLVKFEQFPIILSQARMWSRRVCGPGHVHVSSRLRRPELLRVLPPGPLGPELRLHVSLSQRRHVWSGDGHVHVSPGLARREMRQEVPQAEIRPGVRGDLQVPKRWVLCFLCCFDFRLQLNKLTLRLKVFELTIKSHKTNKTTAECQTFELVVMYELNFTTNDDEWADDFDVVLGKVF